MFDNPGATIKMVGKIVFWILAIGSIVSGAVLQRKIMPDKRLF